MYGCCCSSDRGRDSVSDLSAQQALANLAISKSSMRISCLKVCKDVLYFNFDVEWTFCVCTEKYSYSRWRPKHEHPYTREVLLSLRHQLLSMTVPNININFDETKREKKKKKGSRGEIRNRLRRRGARLPMPSVTLTNARSLVNKMDHLQALVKYDGNYRRSNIVCVTETWFSEEKFHNPDIDGYTSYHQKRKGADRSCM